MGTWLVEVVYALNDIQSGHAEVARYLAHDHLGWHTTGLNHAKRFTTVEAANSAIRQADWLFGTKKTTFQVTLTDDGRVPCPGRQHVRGLTCDWCGGAGRVTPKVAEAMARLEPAT